MSTIPRDRVDLRVVPAGDEPGRDVPGRSVRRIGSPGHPRIVVSGEAGCAAAGEVGEAIAPAVAERPHHLTVDLRAVTFADSSFLKVLLGGKASADAAGIAFTLVLGDDGTVSRLFALTGLAGHFTLAGAAAGRG